ncbi:uncharacterized protein LOC128127409 [Lactuca sativa]|uniref:uncharacterized protein LOC128127409 n=1 Tax=Lactuca sativa TaxID=4236 RepID=UPI0022AEC216|nr:uncharacterized protein LOC128127409 [Lactuca sativa]
MSSSGNSQPNNEAPILHIDAATFQAAVTVVVAAVLTNLNTGNAITTDKGIENFDCCINPGSQQRATVMEVQSRKTKKRKRYRQARRERQRSQRLVMQQQQVATPAPSAPAQPISQAPDIGTNSAHKGGGKTGPHKRKVSKWMNEDVTTRNFVSFRMAGFHHPGDPYFPNQGNNGLLEESNKDPREEPEEDLEEDPEEEEEEIEEEPAEPVADDGEEESGDDIDDDSDAESEVINPPYPVRVPAH